MALLGTLVVVLAVVVVFVAVLLLLASLVVATAVLLVGTLLAAIVVVGSVGSSATVEEKFSSSLSIRTIRHSNPRHHVADLGHTRERCRSRLGYDHRSRHLAAGRSHPRNDLAEEDLT